MSKLIRSLSVIAVALAFGFTAAVSSAAPANGPAFVPNEVLVQYRAGTSEAQQNAARGRANAQRGEGIRDRLELVKLPAGANVRAAIATLQSDPAVEFAEPNWIYTHGTHGADSTDPYYTNGSLWGMYGDATSPANQYGSQAGEAWAADHTGASTVVVGVIDEGIQVTHPDLDANIWKNPGETPNNKVDDDNNGYVDDVHGWDFVNNDNTVYDGGRTGNADKHGTHVAGTIGAESNGTGVVGVNWNVQMISAKFLGRFGGTLANAIKAVDYITDLKTRHLVDIVATNNSWGGGGYSQALLEAINRGGDAGILFIAAAGNDGTDNDTTVRYPSTYECTNGGTRDWDCVIAVASITSTGEKSSFSNYGAKTVDLGAPGSGIYSTLPVNTYGSYSGTSMATPHVTGGAALRAAHSTDRGAALKTKILSTTVPTASLSGITVTGGRLDVSGY